MLADFGRALTQLILYNRFFVKSCGWILTQNEGDASERWQHAGEDFEPKVVFIAQPVCSSLDDADFVVEPLDEAQRDFVLRFAVGGDAIPMTVNHVGELFVGLQSLPLERCAPVFEEAPRPALVLVAPELEPNSAEGNMTAAAGRTAPAVPQYEITRLVAML